MAEPGDEQRWIRESLAGDEDAYAGLVARYQHMVHALTYRMTGSMHDAEDLAQEAFIRAFRQLHTFQGGSKFSTWLCRIAMNTCLNWRGREDRRAEVHARWTVESSLTGEREMPGDPPLDVSQHVQDALGRLPAKQRAAVVLTIYDGLTHGEAARVLGCTEPTVSWRVFAARNKLRKLLRNVSICTKS